MGTQPPVAMGAAGPVTVWVPGWHPASLNQMQGWHWRRIHRLKKGDVFVVHAHAKRTPLTQARAADGASGERRHVALTIVLRPRQRACDADNYWKSLLDALKRCGYLVDDSRQWCEWDRPTFERGGPRTWGTRITVTPLDRRAIRNRPPRAKKLLTRS